MKKIYLSIFLIVMVGVVSAFGQRQTEKAIALGAGEYLTIPLTVGSNGMQIKAKFRARGGSGNDVEVFILDEDGFENWKNGHAANTYYNSGRVTVGKINVDLSEGTYYWIFSNRFSSLSSKAVALTIFE